MFTISLCLRSNQDQAQLVGTGPPVCKPAAPAACIIWVPDGRLSIG